MHTNPLLFITPIDLLGDPMQTGAKSYISLHNVAYIFKVNH
jgi:hypothetical protein